MAKTDRIDAELIARFMAFRPEAGRRLPSGKLRDLRALTTKRKQLVEMGRLPRLDGLPRRSRLTNIIEPYPGHTKALDPTLGIGLGKTRVAGGVHTQSP